MSKSLSSAYEQIFIHRKQNISLARPGWVDLVITVRALNHARQVEAVLPPLVPIQSLFGFERPRALVASKLFLGFGCCFDRGFRGAFHFSDFGRLGRHVVDLVQMLAFLLSVGKNLHLAVEDVSLLERKIDVSSSASLEGVKSGTGRAIFSCFPSIFNCWWP